VLVTTELRRRACAAIIDWPTWVRVWPDLLWGDRIHVSEAGQRVLAFLMRDTVALQRGNHVPPPVPPTVVPPTTTTPPTTTVPSTTAPPTTTG
jgi:hypothetical protein